MRTYSQDLRQRILQAVDQGKPRAEIIKMFDVSRATIKRYLKLRRETGEVRAKAIPRRPSKKGAALRAGLHPQLEAYPDATLAEQCHYWETTKARPGQLRYDEPCNPTPGPEQARKRRYARVNRRKQITQPGEHRPKHWLQANWSLSMNVAPLSP